MIKLTTELEPGDIFLEEGIYRKVKKVEEATKINTVGYLHSHNLYYKILNGKERGGNRITPVNGKSLMWIVQGNKDDKVKKVEEVETGDYLLVLSHFYKVSHIEYGKRNPVCKINLRGLNYSQTKVYSLAMHCIVFPKEHSMSLDEVFRCMK